MKTFPLSLQTHLNSGTTTLAWCWRLARNDGNPYSDNAATFGQSVYPWRGRITCSPAAGFVGTVDKTAAATAQASAFFGTAAPTDFSITGETVAWVGGVDWGYRRFILHYAHLCAAAGGVDAFLLGSELTGLTTIRDGATIANGATSYPAVGRDLNTYERRVNAAIKVSLKRHQFDALVSFDFNTGGIFKARLTQRINAGDPRDWPGLYQGRAAGVLSQNWGWKMAQKPGNRRRLSMIHRKCPITQTGLSLQVQKHSNNSRKLAICWGSSRSGQSRLGGRLNS